MEAAVRDLFARYEKFFHQALAGDLDADQLAALYATDFIAASPAGVRAGHNDQTLLRAMAQGYDWYRKIGTTGMRIRSIRLDPIDPLHCLAHIGWSATYTRPDLPETTVDFELHYLVQVIDGVAKVFGWVAGDEQTLLRQHGII